MLILRKLKEHGALVLVDVLFVVLQMALQTCFIMPEMKAIIDQGVANADLDAVFRSGAYMLALTVLAGLCTVASSYASARVVAAVTCDIRKDCFSKVMELDLADYNSFGASTLIIRTVANAQQIQVLLINLLRTSLMVPIIIVFMLALIFRMNVVLFSILAVAFALTLAVLIFFGAKANPRFALLQTKIDRITLLVKERLSGVRTVRAFNNEDFEEARFEGAAQEAYDAAVAANRGINFLAPAAMVLMNWAIVVIYYAGGAQIQAGLASVSDLLLIFQYLGYFISALAVIPVMVNLIPQAVVAVRRIDELLDFEGRDGRAAKGADAGKAAAEGVAADTATPADSAARASAASADVANRVSAASADAADHASAAPAGRVEFRDVCFGYNDAANVLDHVSFVAEPGKVTAFIGGTGSGKSTIMNLLMGLFPAGSGQILLDGQPIDDRDPHDLRSRVSFATQTPQVFADTARNNITAYDSSIGPNRVRAACEAARFDEVVDKMPEGLDTVMAQGGMNISGGQRQRLNLARAFAKRADVYLLDDSLSALDAKTEAAVRANIDTFLAGKTVLMVAQKVSAIRGVDHIIVLDNGRVVGEGNHEELLASCEEYREIYATQCYQREGGEGHGEA